MGGQPESVKKMRLQQINKLRSAEVQFRLASAVHLATTSRVQPLDLPIVWTHGNHAVTYREIALSPDGADYAAFLVKRSATYLMACQIQEAITWLTDSKARSVEGELRSAFEICRLIRNGFAHSPFQPKWRIDPACNQKCFVVEGIIMLDTSDLDGQNFDWRHYGGPLALLRLSEYISDLPPSAGPLRNLKLACKHSVV
jgi:hypothetical protein